jgi:type II secretory pathway predicted ATPase ExeA
LTEVMANPFPWQAHDPASFIVSVRYELLGRLVERALQGERFLVLSGAPGTGKSVMARAIHAELLSRSVTVFRIERGENDTIGSRSIICQLLHKSEAAFQPDDVEILVDTLLVRGDHGQRRAIIIDDAERLRPDALQYLRLVSNMVPEQMPPVIFVGRSSFWDVPGQPASADARDLITCRMELERLSDDEAHAFTRQKLPDRSAHPWLDHAAREAMVRQANGCIGRLAALLTVARDMPGARHKPGGRPTIRDRADCQEPTRTIDKPAPLAAQGFALTILPLSNIVRYPVAISPPAELARNSARWPTVVRRVTAAALTLTVVGAVAYWQLAVYAGQIQSAANSALPSAAAFGAGNAPEAPSASNAVITDVTPATKPPAQASLALAGALPDTSNPLHPSFQPALTAPVFRAFATDDADQPPAATAAELSVAPSDDPDAVWLALDNVSGDQLLSLASAPAEPPAQPSAIGQSAADTEPAAPQLPTATVPEKPPEFLPAPSNTATPALATDSALAASRASRAPGAGIQPSPGDAADVGSPERNAETAQTVASVGWNASTPTTERVPLPATNLVVPPPAVPAIPQPAPDITALLAVPAAPSVNSLVVTPAPVPPHQLATASLPPAVTSVVAPVTSPQVPVVATAPAATAPPASAGAVDIAAPQAPAAPTASVGNSAASLPIPEPPRSPSPAAPAASAPQLDLGLLLSRGNAMLALGDISAARLFYERAAALGSAGAATALGNTYDAAFLASIQAKGIVADQAAALLWYRKAAALGDTEAVRQLKRLAPAR